MSLHLPPKVQSFIQRQEFTQTLPRETVHGAELTGEFSVELFIREQKNAGMTELNRACFEHLVYFHVNPTYVQHPAVRNNHESIKCLLQ